MEEKKLFFPFVRPVILLFLRLHCRTKQFDSAVAQASLHVRRHTAKYQEDLFL